MGELITERIRRNARELKFYGLADTADELVDRAEAGKLGYREFLDLVLESEGGVLEGRRYASRLKLSDCRTKRRSMSSTRASSLSSTPNAWRSCDRCGSCRTRCPR